MPREARALPGFPTPSCSFTCLFCLPACLADPLLPLWSFFISCTFLIMYPNLCQGLSSALLFGSAVYHSCPSAWLPTSTSLTSKGTPFRALTLTSSFVSWLPYPLGSWPNWPHASNIADKLPYLSWNFLQHFILKNIKPTEKLHK